MLGRGYISHYIEYVLSIYITLIAIILREYTAAPYATINTVYFMIGQLIC